MTSAYFESAFSSSSSIGGSVMPCGAATVPAKGCLRMTFFMDRRASLPVAPPDDPDELVRGALDVVVDDHVVELVGRGELDARGVEPALTLLGPLRAAPYEPAHELVPAGRGEEHEPRLGHRRAHLPRALQVDLEHDLLPRRELLLDGTAQRPVTVLAVHDGPLEELPGLDRGREVLGVHEVVVHPVDLTGPRRPRRRGHREPDVRVPLAQVGRHRPLADGCGTCEDGQPSGTRGGQPNLSIRAACW